VTKGIKAALQKITAAHPTLGKHLAATIRRGYFCSYAPDPRHPIYWLGSIALLICEALADDLAILLS
jgi:hypothetical protein